jgi:hypothetical protein
MRRWGLALAGLAALLGADTPAGDEPGFVALFDGRTLSGWTRHGGRAGAWGVEDGLLVGFGEGGGWIGTGRPYADFVLRLEFRMTAGSNSGVYLRAPADTSHISRTGLEVQLLDDEHPRYRGLHAWQYTGSIYHVAAAERGHLRPAGQWNALEIRAEGPHIVVTLNGARVVDDRIDRHPELEAEHPGLGRKQGLIGLQSHDGRVEFRQLRVKDLGASR